MGEGSFGQVRMDWVRSVLNLPSCWNLIKIKGIGKTFVKLENQGSSGEDYLDWPGME